MTSCVPKPLRVLALATYPMEAAASRYRILQFVPRLARHGISLAFRPFLTAPVYARLYQRRYAIWNAAAILLLTVRRLGDVLRAARSDVLWIQREAMLLGPPWAEWIMARVFRKPLVLDLDDATYLSIASPVYGRWAALFKWPSKTNALIRWSRVVICGNETIAAYVRGRGTPAVVLPTVVDTEVFHPRRDALGSDVPLIGWIGSHSTFVYVEPLLEVFRRVAQRHPFRLRIVGSGRQSVAVEGVVVDVLPWSLEREVDDFRSLDIGIYPLGNDSWAAAKSGLKAIQYMAVGVPYVVAPVGVAAQLGEPGRTHLEAVTADEWYDALAELLASPTRRSEMGAAGRRYAVEHFSVDHHADEIAEVLRRTAESVR